MLSHLLFHTEPQRHGEGNDGVTEKRNDGMTEMEDYV